MEIGTRIKAAREKAGLMQHQLADKIGLTPQHISALECGINKPSYITLIRLCQALHVTSDYLIMGIDDNQEQPSFFRWFSYLTEQEKQDMLKGMNIFNDVMKDTSVYSCFSQSGDGISSDKR